MGVCDQADGAAEAETDEVVREAAFRERGVLAGVGSVSGVELRATEEERVETMLGGSREGKADKFWERVDASGEGGGRRSNLGQRGVVAGEAVCLWSLLGLLGLGGAGLKLRKAQGEEGRGIYSTGGREDGRGWNG